MKNIHILPTDKPTRIFKSEITSFLHLYHHDARYFLTGQHIYITSDEEIKEGDWVYCLREYLEPVLKQKVNPIGVNNDKMFKKIILTTDVDLIKDGVQAIPDEFLQWFVNNPTCEEVGIFPVKRQCDEKSCDDCQCTDEYKITIPKEEPKQGLNLPLLEQKLDEALSNETEESLNTWLKEKRDKQETLEEAADKIFGINPYDHSEKEGFIKGAKWQAERIFKWLASKDYLSDKLETIEKEWFEQVKKK